MALIFSDPITGTPGVNLNVYNPNWVMVPGATGNLVINANGEQANGDASGGTAAYVRNDVVPPSPDYEFTSDLTFAGSVPSGPAAGVMVRGSATTNQGYEFRFLSTGSGGGTWQLRRITGGTGIVLASAMGAYTVGQVAALKIRAAADQISAFLDGAATPVLGPVTDSTIAEAGRPGLRGINALATRFRFDNLRADTLGAAVTPIALAIGPTSQAASTSVIALKQRHKLTTGATTQAASAPVVTIKQRHKMVVGTAAQGASTPAIAVKQRHRLVLAPTVQRASAPLVGLGVVAVPIALVLPPATQRASAPTIVLRQRHRLVPAAMVQRSSAPAIALGHAVPVAGDIDASLVPAARTVVFEGSKRIVVFPGNKRVVTFGGSKRIVRF